MKLSCLVVDDEQLARELLEQYISKVPFLELKGLVKNPLEVFEYLEKDTVDIIFLDIQMPDLSGIDLLKSMSSKPIVIFTTAYSEYAIESYELNALDYLVKPFSFERFMKSVNKAVELIKLKQNSAIPVSGQEYISIHADHKIYRIRLDDILYIEGLREYVSYYTSEKRIVTLASLKNLEETLPESMFMRIHKSYIIPVRKVKAVEGNMIDLGIKKIPIGRSYRDKVFKVFSV
ncbi:MAG: LytTR family DNA-binding domain-containing protein [Cyclobacteriaceae bacterium]|jgi:DNA-binding LytR/AlgR family response regulator